MWYVYSRPYVRVAYASGNLIVVASYGHIYVQISKRIRNKRNDYCMHDDKRTIYIHVRLTHMSVPTATRTYKKWACSRVTCQPA
jgi:hypothetical protein